MTAAHFTAFSVLFFFFFFFFGGGGGGEGKVITVEFQWLETDGSFTTTVSAFLTH